MHSTGCDAIFGIDANVARSGGAQAIVAAGVPAVNIACVGGDGPAGVWEDLAAALEAFFFGNGYRQPAAVPRDTTAITGISGGGIKDRRLSDDTEVQVRGQPI